MTEFLRGFWAPRLQQQAVISWHRWLLLSQAQGAGDRVGWGNDACFAKSSSNPSVFQVKYFTFNKLPFSNKNLAQCSVSSQLKSQVKTNVWSSIWCQFVLITWSSISKEQTYAFASLSGGSSPESYCQDLKFICEAMETKLFNTPVIIMLSSIIPFLS